MFIRLLEYVVIISPHCLVVRLALLEVVSFERLCVPERAAPFGAGEPVDGPVRLGRDGLGRPVPCLVIRVVLSVAQVRAEERAFPVVVRRLDGPFLHDLEAQSALQLRRGHRVAGPAPNLAGQRHALLERLAVPTFR